MVILYWLTLSPVSDGSTLFSIKLKICVCVCVTYAACKYVTVSTFNALKVFAVVQVGRDVNLII